jgi:HEAT repeat protein
MTHQAMKIIRRLAYILAMLSLVLFLVGLVREALRSREPAYQGKSLSVWLRQFEEAKVNSPTSRYHLSPTEFQAQFVEPTHDALRHMGTNALPRLLSLLRAQNSPLQQRAEALLGRLPFIRWRPPSQELRRSMALSGFSALGTNAQPAVPALIALLNNKDGEIRKYAAWCLGSVGPAAEQAVPALIQHLADLDSAVGESAESSLGRIHRKPELVIPVLKERLAGAGKKWLTLFALGCFGPEAKAAVPAILPLLDDRDRETRTWAAMSLKRIDPVAAARAKVESP